ncbi:MAG: M15 family metallopeptidase [Rheinheimera sp.]|nr:M15 family metallopeptidase [Rheinheimera sp.]
MQPLDAISSEILTGLDEQHLCCREDGFMLHRQVLQPFAKLCQAASADGIEIKLVSAYRAFSRQAAIWQAKLDGNRPVYDQHGARVNIRSLSGKAKLDAVLLYSALPGASRHHWGTDLDIYDAAAVPADYKPQLDPAEYAPGGPFNALQQWLSANSGEFGFFLPYAKYQGGVAAEPWHLSYQPLASQFLASFSADTLRQCLLKHPIAEQQLVLEHLEQLVAQYVCNICPPPAI